MGFNQCSSLNIPNELRISQHRIMVLHQTGIQSLSEKMMVLFTAERIGWLVPIGWGHCVQCFGCWPKIIYSKVLFFVQRLQQFYWSIVCIEQQCKYPVQTNRYGTRNQWMQFALVLIVCRPLPGANIEKWCFLIVNYRVYSLINIGLSCSKYS